MKQGNKGKGGGGVLEYSTVPRQTLTVPLAEPSPMSSMSLSSIFFSSFSSKSVLAVKVSLKTRISDCRSGRLLCDRSAAFARSVTTCRDRRGGGDGWGRAWGWSNFEAKLVRNRCAFV